MACKIRFEAKAADEFRKLNKSIKAQVEKYIDKLVELDDPTDRGKPLKANLANLWSYRIGDYRIVCEIKDTEQANEFIINVLRISHRRDVYSLKFY